MNKYINVHNSNGIYVSSEEVNNRLVNLYNEINKTFMLSNSEEFILEMMNLFIEKMEATIIPSISFLNMNDS